MKSKNTIHSNSAMEDQVIQKLPHRCPYCEQPISYEKYHLKKGENEIKCPSCNKIFIKIESWSLFYLFDFYPPTQKTTPACQNSGLPDALIDHFGVQARALPVNECGLRSQVVAVPLGSCYGGFRWWRITLRSLGVGGYYMEAPRACPWGSIHTFYQGLYFWTS